MIIIDRIAHNKAMHSTFYALSACVNGRSSHSVTHTAIA